MDMKTGFLVLLLLVGCFAIPAPKDDMSIFFNRGDPRIIGGTEAAVGSHPHMVGIAVGLLVRLFACGGSLVTPRTVLTAAHCIEAVYSNGALMNTLRVTVGTNRWNSGGSVYTLAGNVTHNDYHIADIKHDIGLLITSRDVVLSNLVQLVTLNYNFVPQGVVSRHAGWGMTAVGGIHSPVLLELTVLTIEGNDCVERLASKADEIQIPGHVPHVDPSIELCVLHSAGHGTCYGDSGSALLRIDSGQQIGVVSWGLPCAHGAPDIYVRISAYQSWLNENVV